MMFKKKNKSFISEIELCRDNSIEGRYAATPCAKEILPMVKQFLKDCMKAGQWEKSNNPMCNNIIEIAKIVEHVAGNTRNYEKLSDADILSLEKIFDELDMLLDEALENNCHCQSDDFLKKIQSILIVAQLNHWFMSDIKEKSENWRDGMFLQNYENLWKVIHQINSNWKELFQRGLRKNMLGSYLADTCLHFKEKPEEQRFKELMEFFDGKKKLVPVYIHEYTLQYFDIVDTDFDDEIIHTSKLKKVKPYYLSQKNN